MTFYNNTKSIRIDRIDELAFDATHTPIKTKVTGGGIHIIGDQYIPHEFELTLPQFIDQYTPGDNEARKWVNDHMSLYYAATKFDVVVPDREVVIIHE